MDLIKAKGGKVTREPGPVKGGNSVIAFIEDPDGYKFELLERGPTPEPLCQVMLRVGDLDRSINFYEKVSLFFFYEPRRWYTSFDSWWQAGAWFQAFGMELLRKRDNPEYKVTLHVFLYGWQIWMANLIKVFTWMRHHPFFLSFIDN